MAQVATERDIFLKPLSEHQNNSVEGADPQQNVGASVHIPSLQYEFKLDSLETTQFVELSQHEGKLIVGLNRHHEFYLHLWKPLCEREPQLARAMELCLFGLARAWAGSQSLDVRQNYDALLNDWSRAISVFLRGRH